MNSTGSSVRRYQVLLLLFTTLTAVYLGLTVWAHSVLPDRIPVHFDGSGIPNRWAGKGEFLGVNLSIAVLLFVTFALGAVFLPKIPAKWLNLPNKDYWLTPERRDRSFADLNSCYLAMGILTLLFLGWIGWSAFEVAMGRQETLLYSWSSMGIYFGLLTFLCVRLYCRFGKKAMRDDD